jgi:hypothetical protein
VSALNIPDVDQTFSIGALWRQWYLVTENIDDGTQCIQEIEISSYVISLSDDNFIFIAQKIFVTYLCNTKIGKKKENLKKRDVSRVTCLSKQITQQF